MSDWKNLVNLEYAMSFCNDLFNMKSYYNILPQKEDVFRALDLVPPSDVKVVIVGQDPYHGKDQANGLAFSVNKGLPLPPSLKNIYEELESDLDIWTPRHGDLTRWAKQGVLLLNSVLTVYENQPASHYLFGWEMFTDQIIRELSKNHSNIVFVLWGKKAQSKRLLIDSTKHLIIESAHPSPLSASKGFFGSKPFSKINKYLKEIGKHPIDWRLE